MLETIFGIQASCRLGSDESLSGGRWLLGLSSIRDCQNKKFPISIPPQRHGMAFVKLGIVVNQGCQFGTIPLPLGRDTLLAEFSWQGTLDNGCGAGLFKHAGCLKKF